MPEESSAKPVAVSTGGRGPAPMKVGRWSEYRAWITIAIFILALLIRLPGITWGLKNDLHNQSYHPDEEINWRASREIEPLKFSFTPGQYNYGTFYLTALRVGSDIAGTLQPSPKNPVSDWDYIARGELAGRVISALSGAALASVLCWLGIMVFGEISGLVAGLVGAISPGLVLHSRFATVDIFATLWIALVAVSAIRLLDLSLGTKALWRHIVFAGIFAGFAAGTKYTGGLSILMVVSALAISQRKEWLMKAAIAVLITIGAFVATTPGILLDKEAFWRDFKYEQNHIATGHGLVFVGTPSGYIYQLTNLFAVVSFLTILLGLGGLVWAAIQRQKWVYVLLPFFLIYGVLIGGAAVKFARYSFPLIPAIAIGAGYAVGQGFAYGRRGAWVVAFGMFGIAGIPGQGGLIGTVNVTESMVAPDPRDLGAQELKNASTPGTTVGLPEDPWFWSVPLFPDSTEIRAMYLRGGDNLRQEATKPAVLQYKSDQSPAWNSELLTKLKPDYVTYSDLENFDLERLSQAGFDLPSDVSQRVENYKAFMSVLKQNYEPWQVIGRQSRDVEDLRYSEPTVYIWKRKSPR